MANDLTGDFDVAAEFAIPAANRVLASMHRNGRFPHSLTFRVDDIPPAGSNVLGPVAVGSVNAFGDATVDQTRIGKPVPLSGPAAATNFGYSVLDPVVNANLLGGVLGPVRVVPSNLQGSAQLQLSPPALAVNDRSGTNVTVELDIRSRYFPDPGTAPLAEFIHGQLQITAAVNQVTSQAANVLDIDVHADTLVIDFTPSFSSQPLSAADIAAVNLVIRNALKTSLLPSNTTLPATIEYVQFKTLPGPPAAIAVMLDMQGPRGNPASFNNLFLGATDDFALGVGKDFILSAFQPVVTSILSTPIAPITISYDTFFHTFHIHYSITLSAVTLDLQAGEIVLTIKGHAHTPSSLLPDFDFTVQQDFALKPDGDTVDLVVGDMSLDTSSWVVNLFKSAATSGMESMRDQALAQSGVAATVSKMLNADSILGGFLGSLLNTTGRSTIFSRRGFTLAYTSVDIQPSGIVLHGTLAVTGWPAVDVEYERIPTSAATGPGGIIVGGVSPGPDYSALLSWIPGGTIQRFDWSTQGQPQPFLTDENKFVYIHPPLGATTGIAAAVSIPAYAPLCLTVRGSRLTASGPVSAQPVSATACGVTWHPIIGPVQAAGLNGVAATMALAQSGPGGQLQVTGSALAGMDLTGKNLPNLLVHFAGDSTFNRLESLTRALQQSKRQDAATAVLAVLTPAQLSKAPYTEGIIYGEDQNGAWDRAFGAKSAQRPATLIVSPKGQILWQQNGDIDPTALAASLQKFLVAGAILQLGVFRTNLQIGRPSPNFVFEFAPGRELTLRKLTGSDVALVFWRSSSQPSIDAVLDLLKAAKGGAAQGPVILAINDGEPADLAANIAAANGFSAALVPDPKREISATYGLRIWPTTVYLDSLGLVRAIQHGYSAAQRSK